MAGQHLKWICGFANAEGSSTNQMLKGAALDRFLLRRHGRTWEGVPLPGLTLADLDAAALCGFANAAGLTGGARQNRLSPANLV
jgi:hypothetical protein